jgi:hypothetical protein
MLALVTAKEASVASGLVPAIGAGTLDGFAVGMLLSGGVLLLIMAQRRAPRRARWPIGAPSLGRRGTGYRSKHRIAAREEAAREKAGREEAVRDETAWDEVVREETARDAGLPLPDGGRRAPRHAAPSSALVSRVTGLVPAKVLAVRH